MPQFEPHLEKLVESVRSLPQEDFVDIMSRCKTRLSMRVNGECMVGPNSEEWLSKTS
jgi:ArsR family transcriptional regulator